MDFLPDAEFNKLFDRVSMTINLKGAGSPAEINRRLHQKIMEIKYEAGSDQLAQLRARKRIAPLKTLIFAGFGRRTINEAISNPQGEVALTLKFGKLRARAILLARARRRLRW